METGKRVQSHYEMLAKEKVRYLEVKLTYCKAL